MNDDIYSGELHAWIEPEIEARVVALVLGEASAFEADELERLMEERPEIRVFKRRLESVHGLLGTAMAPADDDEWALSPSRRAELAKAIELPVAAEEATPTESAEAGRAKERRIRKAGRRVMWGVAACVAITLFVFALLSRSGFKGGIAFSELEGGEDEKAGRRDGGRRVLGESENYQRLSSYRSENGRKSGDDFGLAERAEPASEATGPADSRGLARLDAAPPEASPEPAGANRGEPSALAKLKAMLDEQSAPQDGERPATRPEPASEPLSGLDRSATTFALTPPTPVEAPLVVPAGKPQAGAELADADFDTKAHPAANEFEQLEGRAPGRPGDANAPANQPAIDGTRSKRLSQVDAKGGMAVPPAANPEAGVVEQTRGRVTGGVGGVAGSGDQPAGLAPDPANQNLAFRPVSPPAGPTAESITGLRGGRELASVEDMKDDGDGLEAQFARDAQGESRRRSLGLEIRGNTATEDQAVRREVPADPANDYSDSFVDRVPPATPAPGGIVAGKPVAADEESRRYDVVSGNEGGRAIKAPVLGDVLTMGRQLAKEAESGEEGQAAPGEPVAEQRGFGAVPAGDDDNAITSLSVANGANFGEAETRFGRPERETRAGVVPAQPDAPGEEVSDVLASGFNVHSISKEAWNATLAPQQGQQVERIGEQSFHYPTEYNPPELPNFDYGIGSGTQGGVSNWRDAGLQKNLTDLYVTPTPEDAAENIAGYFRGGGERFGMTLRLGSERKDFNAEQNRWFDSSAEPSLLGTHVGGFVQSVPTPEQRLEEQLAEVEEAVNLVDEESNGAVLINPPATPSELSAANEVGRYAFWVGDLGVKADVQLVDKAEERAEQPAGSLAIRPPLVPADAPDTGLHTMLNADEPVDPGRAKGEAEGVEVRTWDIPLAAWAKIRDGEATDGGKLNAKELLAVQDDLHAFTPPAEALQQYGVDFPEGAEVDYAAATGKLLVKNTPANLGLIDTLVRTSLERVAQESEALDGFEQSAAAEPFSTFSLHVSDVSYKLAKAALERGEWPAAEQVRVEEFVNAFDYGDPAPTQDEKVACELEQAAHPFLQQRNLLRIAMRTAAAGRAAGTPLRLTILLDKSGSMERHDRVESVRSAFRLLAAQLQGHDQVTLISFARQPRLMADRMAGDQAGRLADLVEATPSEGGTNLEEALRAGLGKAREQWIEGGQNRIILLTDGAANLGNAKPEELAKLVVEMRGEGIAFDACGVGAEDANDGILEALTRNGDGRYYFLDRPEDADEGFARQIAGALRPAARNVKVQVNFNPERVGRYRLHGFEKHLLKKEDFRNDSVDAAELAAEEAGNAVYQVEVLPEGTGELGSVSVRFQDMASGQMVEKEWTIPYQPNASPLEEAAPSMRLAAGAALLGEKLKRSIIGEAVEMSRLAGLLETLPAEFPSDDRVRGLADMARKARELAAE